MTEFEGQVLGDLRVLGISEVAVHPDHRGRALSKHLLSEFGSWAAQNGFPFAALFGSPALYGPQGYRLVDNPIRFLDPASGLEQVTQAGGLQVKALGTIPWPQGLIDLAGPTW